MKRLIHLATCAALVSLGGCVSDDGEKPTLDPGIQAPDTPEQPGDAPRVNDPVVRPAPGTVGVDTREEGEVDLRPELVDEEPARPRRRLNIDQLEDAMIRASGGIGWTEERGNNTVNVFQELARTLGKPDYIQITEEDLEPTILFQKFLGDASRSVCAKMLARDLSTIAVEQEFELRPYDDPPEDLPQKTLMIHVTPEDTWASNPDAVDANLRALLVRFHGKIVGPEDDVALANWRWLVQSGRHVSEPSQAWMATCVALFTHPDFYTF